MLSCKSLQSNFSNQNLVNQNSSQDASANQFYAENLTATELLSSVIELPGLEAFSKTSNQKLSNTDKINDFDQTQLSFITANYSNFHPTLSDQLPLNSSASDIQRHKESKNDAWQRLRDGMKMTSTDNKRITKQLDWFVKNPDYMLRVMERARPILPYILDELEGNELPTEFALLPIVESAFQTFAYSHGRASGLWQIIPSTGRHLGLIQNWWYDGRRDILASTKAAAKYLKSLAKQFDNDWELTLAAYNAGPGKIRSAIRYNKKKNRPTDFWHLTNLRKETKDYVPKLLALKALFGNPENYNFTPIEVENTYIYTLVNTHQQIDLALAAELADLSIDQLYRLNPAINRWATAPDGPHELLLPKVKAARFKQNLSMLPEQKRINWVRYKIKLGDTLSQISEKFRTSTQLIRKVNKIHRNNIRAGKYLLIPTATRSLSSYSLSKNSRTQKVKNTHRKGIKTVHIVNSGDSFWSLSKMYKVSINSLAMWNDMARRDTLRVGQRLLIWSNPENAKIVRVSLIPIQPERSLRALRYTVRKGDSLSLIANKFNIKLSDIRKWNELGRYLQPGQKIKLYIDITRQSG